MHPIQIIQQTAMPTPVMVLDDDAHVPGAKINVLYLAPGHEIIRPAQIPAEETKTVGIQGGASISKLSPSMLVKWGTHVSLIEAKTMLFVAKETSIPIPTLYAAYTYGPLDRDVDDFGSQYDTYLFMASVEGETLERCWPTLDAATKSQISSELKTSIDQLRSIPAPNYIGSVDDGIVTDMILEWSRGSKGPFASEEEFNATIADAYIAKAKGHVGPFIRGMLSSIKHQIRFAHGDFRPPNIIIQNGHVAGILDWELGGWYPEYWDFVKAFYLEHFVTDWPVYLLGILEPYYPEQAIHSKLTDVLW
ncbi:hypothetical protein PVAG01_08898 [Phlyctema vagabunda]|uniref:Aminoglycoside phosphotransferase domain-containing protein n=1 Tax=Phlyctema vagabunda TaxID=108571 RepID=A0ABR4PAQ6_9HELO